MNYQLSTVNYQLQKYRIVQDRIYKSDFDKLLEEMNLKIEANKK